MKRKILLYSGVAVLFLSIFGYIIYDIYGANSPAEVAEKITLTYVMDDEGNIGFTQDVGWVKVRDYSKGSEADIIYRVTNNIPDKTIAVKFAKIFTVRPEDKPELHGRGYKTVPSYYSDWIDTSVKGVLAYGDTAEYTLVLMIPENVSEEIPGKWVFQTIADVDVGGFAQVAPAVWWTIDMR